MPWLRVDDNLHAHRKFAGLPPAAAGLWLFGASYVAHYLTDGVILERDLPRLMAWVKPRTVRRLADVLVDRKLWERIHGGFLIHDWLDYNPRASAVQAERAAIRTRVADWRQKHKRNNTSGRFGNAVTPGVTEPDGNAVTDPPCNSVTNALVTPTPVPVPVPVLQEVGENYRIRGDGDPTSSEIASDLLGDRTGSNNGTGTDPDPLEPYRVFYADVAAKLDTPAEREDLFARLLKNNASLIYFDEPVVRNALKHVVKPRSAPA